MENATKALEIAAGVLMSVLVLGLLIFAYNKLSGVKQTEQDTTEQSQAVNFNKQFEVYNKNGIYGSELLSLANLVNNYNTRESDSQGYAEMNLEVKINKIDEGIYFKSNVYYENKNSHTLTEKYKELSNEVSTLGGTKDVSSNKTYKQLSLLSSKALLGVTYDSVNLTRYKNLLNEQSDIATLTFNVKEVKYDTNGRMTLMSFIQN